MYLGIDPGVKSLGYCVLDNNLLIKEINIISPDNDNCFFGEKLHKIYLNLHEILRKHDVEGIGCEAPSYGSTGRAYTLGAVHGIIHLIVAQAGKPFITAAPGQIKKFITGSGNARKETIRKSLETCYNISIPEDLPDDASDATAMAVIANYYFSQCKCKRRCELEVVNKLNIKKYI